MNGDECKVVTLHKVEVQENGIIRDEYGWILGRADDEWMRYQWRFLETGRCPLCGMKADYDRDRAKTMPELRREGGGVNCRGSKDYAKR